MPARLFTVFVVLFWAASVGWLCAVVWAPPESRMSRVDPREVYDTFFAWNDSTSMTLLENGARRGQLTVSGGSGVDPGADEYANTLSFSGALESPDGLPSSTGLELFGKGVLEFDREMAVRSGDFALRVPGRRLTAQLAFSGQPPVYEVRVALGQREVFRFDGEMGEEGANLPAQLIPMASMLDFSAFDPASVEWENEARMGDFSFGGRDLRAYLLILTPEGGGQSLRVYFSEAGEPLRIESELGFVAVSEILVPLDAYRSKSSPDEGEPDTDDDTDD